MTFFNIKTQLRFYFYEKNVKLISVSLESIKCFQIGFFSKLLFFCKITCVTFYIHLSLVHGFEMVLCWTVDPHHMAFDPLECVFGSENLRSFGERSTMYKNADGHNFVLCFSVAIVTHPPSGASAQKIQK